MFIKNSRVECNSIFQATAFLSSIEIPRQVSFFSSVADNALNRREANEPRNCVRRVYF